MAYKESLIYIEKRLQLDMFLMYFLERSVSTLDVTQGRGCKCLQKFEISLINIMEFWHLGDEYLPIFRLTPLISTHLPAQR